MNNSTETHPAVQTKPGDFDIRTLANHILGTALPPKPAPAPASVFDPKWKEAYENLVALGERIVNTHKANRKWHETYENVVAMGEHLVDSYELLTAKEVIAFFSKPWKWSKEWEQFQTEKRD